MLNVIRNILLHFKRANDFLAFTVVFRKVLEAYHSTLCVSNIKSKRISSEKMHPLHSVVGMHRLSLTAMLTTP